MIVASYLKVQLPCSCCGKRESAGELDQRGLNTKLDLARDRNGRPIRAMITEGTTEDCSPTWRSETRNLGSAFTGRWGLWWPNYSSKRQSSWDAAGLFDPRKRENIREMTTKIETKGGRDSKMCSGILNDGVEWPQVRVKTQTLF